MTTGRDSALRWSQIGKSRSSPIDNTKRAEVTLDSYYLVVGFEVNFPKAFVDGKHDVAIDYGHAFFYIVKNSKIVKSFSFGPADAGKIGWFNKGERPGFGRNAYNVGAFKKDGISNSRPGTADYPITELVKAFRIILSIEQANKLEVETEKARLEILDGKIQYTAMLNDTCAETAKEVLDDAGIKTPSGSGLVKHSRIVNFPVAYAVNPYKWHEGFQEKYTDASYKVTSRFGGGWIPAAGDDDPIFGVPALAKGNPIFGVGL